MKRIVVAVLISMTLFASITGCGKGADIGKEKATDIALGTALRIGCYPSSGIQGERRRPEYLRSELYLRDY